jgi:hypothetical protein
MTVEAQKGDGTPSLWAAVLGAPAVWAIHLQLNYALVQFVCLWQRKWLLPAVTIACLVLAGMGTLVALLEWRNAPTAEDDEIDHTRFLAILGVMTGTLFFVTILATGLPTFFFNPCQD